MLVEPVVWVAFHIASQARPALLQRLGLLATLQAHFASNVGQCQRDPVHKFELAANAVTAFGPIIGVSVRSRVAIEEYQLRLLNKGLMAPTCAAAAAWPRGPQRVQFVCGKRSAPVAFQFEMPAVTHTGVHSEALLFGKLLPFWQDGALELPPFRTEDMT
jgi:hypothetical protein